MLSGGRYQFNSWVEDLENTHTLIYVGDNAGEVEFLIGSFWKKYLRGKRFFCGKR